MHWGPSCGRAGGLSLGIPSGPGDLAGKLTEGCLVNTGRRHPVIRNPCAYWPKSRVFHDCVLYSPWVYRTPAWVSFQREDLVTLSVFEPAYRLFTKTWQGEMSQHKLIGKLEYPTPPLSYLKFFKNKNPKYTNCRVIIEPKLVKCCFVPGYLFTALRKNLLIYSGPSRGSTTVIYRTGDHQQAACKSK